MQNEAAQSTYNPCVSMLMSYLQCMKLSGNDFENICKNDFESYDTCEKEFEASNHVVATDALDNQIRTQL